MQDTKEKSRKQMDRKQEGAPERCADVTWKTLRSRGESRSAGYGESEISSRSVVSWKGVGGNAGRRAGVTASGFQESGMNATGV